MRGYPRRPFFSKKKALGERKLSPGCGNEKGFGNGQRGKVEGLVT
jgi:hypothetical protein